MAIENPLGNRSTTLYDAAGKPKASINPLGQRTSTTYDTAGQSIAVTDANGNIATTVYDAISQPIAEVNALGNRNTTIYDATGNTLALIDAKGNRNSFTYDARGLETQKIDPLDRRTTSAYDNAGRQTLRIDARGNRTSYTFDNNDQPTGRHYPDGSRATFSYDAVGNRTTMKDTTGTYTTTYDALDRNQTVTNPADKTITYTYDAVSNRAHMVDPDARRFTYAYDAADRIESLENPQNERTSYSYDTAGRRTLTKLANGTRASFTHDAADNLITLANIDSGSAYISRFDYEYDNTGNRTSVLEVNSDRVTWSYDKTSQLTAEHRSGANAYANTFTYDAAGNRTLKNEDTTRTTFTFDVANQIETSLDASGTTTYTFDNNGNQQIVEAPNGDRTTNTWNYENLTTKVEQPGNSISTYTWNADNHRVGKNVDATETKMVWDDENILLETDGSNATKVIYTLEPQIYGNVVSERRKAGAIWTPSYYHFDALGSTRNLTDENENVTDTWIYDAYGKILSHVGASEISFLWIGEVQYYYDVETGEYTIRVRVYGPLIARWISVDPLYENGLNWLAYALNNPVLFSDPSGYKVLDAIPKQKGYYVVAGQERFRGMIDVILGIRASRWKKGGKEQKSAEEFIQNWNKIVAYPDCFKVKPLWVTYVKGVDRAPTLQFVLDARTRADKSDKAGRCSVFFYLGHSALGADLDVFKDIVGILPKTSRIGISACASKKYNDAIPTGKRLGGCAQFEEGTSLTKMVPAINELFLKEMVKQLRELCTTCNCRDQDPKTSIDVFIYFSDYIEKGDNAAPSKGLGADKTFKNFSFSSWPRLVGSKPDSKKKP